MGLLKEIPTDFGVNASYWRIENVFLDTENKMGTITIKGYSSKENRNNIVPLKSITYSDTMGSDIDLTFFKTFSYDKLTGIVNISRMYDNQVPIDTLWIMTYLYGMVKQTDLFFGATDTLD